MKKFGMYVIFLAIIMSFSMPVFAATTFDDYASDFWAYEALDSLIDVLRIEGYSRHARMNSYEIGIAIVRLLQFMQQTAQYAVEPVPSYQFGNNQELDMYRLVEAYNDAVELERRLTNNEIGKLLRLTGEFGYELRILGYQIKQKPGHLNFENQFLASRETDSFVLPSQIQSSSDRLLSLNEEQVVYVPPVSEVESDTIINDLSFFEVEQRNPRSKISQLSDIWFIEEPDFTNVIDGELYSNKDLSLSAAYHKLIESEEDGLVTDLASLTLQYTPLPDLVVEGLYSQNLARADGMAMQLGINWTVGGFVLGGTVRSRQPGYRPFIDGEEFASSGYALSLSTKNINVNTEIERLSSRSSPEDPDVIATSIDLSYDLPNFIVVSAGIRHVDDLKAVSQITSPSVASVGVEVPIPQGRFRLGITSESSSNLLFPASDDESDVNDSFTKKTTEVGLSYLLGNETSVKFNYQFIDFNSLSGEQKSNVATAEFSIRF